MNRTNRSAAIVLLALLASLPACASPRIDRARIYTSWDSNYFYAAFDVSDSDIQGSSKAPNKPVGNDDGVALYFQTDRERPSAPTEKSFRMTVSAAGGSEFAVGSDGTWVTRPITTFKYAVQRQGSLGDDQDDDTGYQIEVAVPWHELGLSVDVGTALHFNAVVLLSGEHTGFVSIAPDAKSAGTLDDPSLWTELWLRGPVQPLLARGEGRVLTNRAMARPPVVDGRISDVEYAQKNVLELELPPISAARRVFRDIPVEHLIFGTYYTDFALPEGGSLSTTFIHKPMGGFGPWNDPSSVEWHRGQIRDALRAGIDVLLPMVRKGQPWPDTAVERLVIALQQAARDGDDAPRLAPILGSDFGGAPDDMWLAVRGFLDQVPPEVRAQVRLPESRGGTTSVPVFVRGNASLSPEDRTRFDTLARERYGSGLLWILPPGSSGGDGAMPDPFNADGWAFAGEEGWISVAAVTPGYVRDGKLLSRESGSVFSGAWAAVVGRKPDWVVLESFNDFRHASEVAASAEYGLLYTDASSIQTVRFNGTEEYSAKYLAASVPATISSRAMSTARLTVRNVGTRAWRVLDRVKLGYRWYQGGRLYSQGLVQIPIQQDVGINRIADLSVGVVAVDSDRDPLPEGDWLLVFDLLRPDGRPFSNSGDNPLAVPVKVGAPPDFAYSIVGCAIPPVVMSGESYTANVIVRNDGSSDWKAGGLVSLLVAAFRNDADGSAAPRLLASWNAPLAEDVPPGRVVTLPVTLTLREAGGKPLVPPASEPYVYLNLRMAMTPDGKTLSASAGSPATIPTRLQTADHGVSLTGPEQPVVGQEYGKPTKFTIDVTNAGPVAWRDDTRLVAQWYSLDGKLLIANGGEGKIRKGVKPGEKITVNVEMVSPPYPGQYVVQWVPEIGGVLVREGLDSLRDDSVFTQFVTVKGPALEFLDLSAAFDTDLSTAEASPDGASLDGAGASMASHLIPPLVVPTPVPSPLYSVGLFCADPPGGPSYAGVASWRWISFAYPAKQDDARNAVSAQGQSLPVSSLNCSRVHVLCAATGGAKEARFGLGYASGGQSVTVTVPDLSAPAADSVVAYEMPYSLRNGAPEMGTLRLYDVVLACDPSKPLTAVRLPSDASIKVLAVTLEKPLAEK